MLIGYILPTRGGPSVETQRLALRQAGIEDDRVVYVNPAGLAEKLLGHSLRGYAHLRRALRDGFWQHLQGQF